MEKTDVIVERIVSTRLYTVPQNDIIALSISCCDASPSTESTKVVDESGAHVTAG